MFELFGDILIRDNGAKDKLNEIDSQASKVSQGFDNMKKKVAGFVVGAVSIGGVVKSLKDVTDAAVESERADNRLYTLMKNVKGITDNQIQSLKEYASQLQNTGVIEDDTTKAGMSQLATFNLQAESIKKLTPSFQDLAVGVYGVNVSQEQMIQLGNLVGKAAQGQVGALTRYGVTLTENQKKLIENGNEQQRVSAIAEALKANFGGLNEAAAKTTEGGIVQLKNKLGDIKEEMGGKLIPVIMIFVDYVNAHMPEIEKVGGKAVDTLIKGFEFLGDAIDFASKNAEWLIPILSGVVGAITAFKVISTITGLIDAWKATTDIMKLSQLSLNAVLTANPIGAVCVSIGAAIAIGVALYKNWDTVKAKATELWSHISNKFNQIKESVTKPIQTASNFIEGEVDKIKGFFTNLKIKFPHIPLPHFKLNGQFSLSPPSVPKLGVDFYAKGTDYAKGGLSIVGEQGMELLNIPKGSKVTNNKDTMDILKRSSNLTINIEKFMNNREQDIEALAEELEFYRQRISISRGGA